MSYSSCFPGGCQLATAVSSGGYRYLLGQFGLQLNCKVKCSDVQICIYIFLDYLVPLIMCCQVLKLNELQISSVFNSV